LAAGERGLRGPKQIVEKTVHGNMGGLDILRYTLRSKPNQKISKKSPRKKNPSEDSLRISEGS